MADLNWSRILITGAAGKIGATLRAGLAGRYKALRLLDRRPIEGLRPDRKSVV